MRKDLGRQKAGVKIHLISKERQDLAVLFLMVDLQCTIFTAVDME